MIHYSEKPKSGTLLLRFPKQSEQPYLLSCLTDVFEHLCNLWLDWFIYYGTEITVAQKGHWHIYWRFDKQKLDSQ